VLQTVFEKNHQENEDDYVGRGNHHFPDPVTVIAITKAGWQNAFQQAKHATNDNNAKNCANQFGCEREGGYVFKEAFHKESGDCT